MPGKIISRKLVLTLEFTVGSHSRWAAIPLVWKLLGKAGNSSQRERIALMRGLLWFLADEQKSDIQAITADREFVGHRWLCYLIDQDVNFVIRIRKDALVHKGECTTHAHRIFTTENLHILRKPRKVFGLSLYMSGQQLSGDEYLILISTMTNKWWVSTNNAGKLSCCLVV